MHGDNAYQTQLHTKELETVWFFVDVNTAHTVAVTMAHRFAQAVNMVRMREALMENRWRAVESTVHTVVVVMASRYVRAANMVPMLVAPMENRLRCGGEYGSYSRSSDGKQVCAGGEYGSYARSSDGKQVACGGEYGSYSRSSDGKAGMCRRRIWFVCAKL